MTKDKAAAGGRSPAVHRALKRAILDQALPPGTKLPEDSIGERLGVSRTLVREALLRLSEEGLVELRPNRGAAVARPSLEEGYDLFVTRFALEKLVVELLAGKLTGSQQDALSRHIDSEDEARRHGDARSIRLAGEFHTLLASMTGNATLIRYVNELVARSSLILALYGRPHSSECAISEHRQLLEALKAGDAATATQLMTHHLESVTTRALLTRDKVEDIRDVLASYAAAEGL
ncbi:MULTISPECIES: GntR family transcriptional regulator [unclassified Chelatococcus]|uniref:GntR family transcriptional regulator n=1 Tax=unclassified Chelatococcus TaxID=2638111 RepID=UPI001BCBF73A|nr:MULTISPECIES: GntR family transcriptional regulator [unclassified Chelatococcus]CAH1648960.1 FCD domain-containing protein [Hyphomicrobiales bacterium]MBS7741834.1 GntR family transcriptional regulator [Chelatococcus sp. HY11]MBX3541368.1 GntR family transcriptional regulator [Chelatococcus sp.]MCO5074738.1 GntR family transcriptional regulator [Chelatococcus sp.]CAH1691578.1 FCD domain-containing protein [Hyphomicrobiales bacterium]